MSQAHEAARDALLALQAEATPAQEMPFVARLRAEARDAFAAQGLPTTRWEEWRYTSLARLVESRFALEGEDTATPSREEAESVAFPVFACGLFVFVNGQFAPSLSRPATAGGPVRVESLARVLTESPETLEPWLGQLASSKEHPFVALATSFLSDGAVVTVPRSADSQTPIHLVFLTTGDEPHLCQPRVLIRAERGSRALVIQDFVSISKQGGHLRNAVSEVFLEDDADLGLVTLQRGHPRSFLTTGLFARQERNSRFASHVVTLGGQLVRNELQVTLAGEGAECRLDGLFVAGDGEVIDNHTLVDHAVPHCTSAELYKGILDGDGKGVFRGRVVVRPDAQKTAADQSNPNLLLSDGAEIDTKPQLEIYADDVRCSHGSAIGRLDEDALFYLRARGLGEEEARRLLVSGFAAEVLRGLPDEALSSTLMEELRKRLGRREPGARA